MEKTHQRQFIKALISIALPLALQNLIATSLNMADTVMVSSLGEASIAAVGLVNQYIFFYFVIVFGICTGAAIFLAQYYGKRDLGMLHRFFKVMQSVVLLFGSLFTIFTLGFQDQILAMLTPDLLVQNHAREYLQIIQYTLIITGLSFGLGTALRSAGNTKAPMHVSLVAFITNVIINYILIFGKLGFAPMGIQGAAIGTLAARMVELLLLFIAFRDQGSVYSLSMLKSHPTTLKDYQRYFSIATPVILAETFWALGQLLFTILYARISTEATAAIQLTNTIQNVFFILAHSLSDAAAVLTGQTIGRGEYERTFTNSKLFLKFQLIIGLISSLVLILFPRALMLIYSGMDQSVIDLSVHLLIIRGIFITFRFFNGLLIVGLFRGGGDSKYALFYEMLTMWVYAVPICYLGVMTFHWSLETVFFLVSIEEVIKAICILPRYRSKKWITDIT